MKFTAIVGTSVFIVLEHTWVDKTTRPYKIHDAVVHGAYSNRETAENKISKLPSIVDHGYYCVLKKTIEGKKPRIEHYVCEEYGLDDYSIKA